MDNTLLSVFGAYSPSQVVIGIVIILLIGCIYCFRYAAYEKGWQDGYEAGQNHLTNG